MTYLEINAAEEVSLVLESKPRTHYNPITGRCVAKVHCPFVAPDAGDIDETDDLAEIYAMDEPDSETSPSFVNRLFKRKPKQAIAQSTPKCEFCDRTLNDGDIIYYTNSKHSSTVRECIDCVVYMDEITFDPYSPVKNDQVYPF